MCDALRMEFLDEAAAGRIWWPRFTPKEIRASHEPRHDKLWAVVLSLEAARLDAGKGDAGFCEPLRNVPQGGGELRFVRAVATRHESPVEALIGSANDFFDCGMESRIYRASNATVVKTRRIRPRTIEDALDKLSEIVYHNYLFPGDAYTLKDFTVSGQGRDEEFHLVLEQPFVIPETDSAGMIVPPDESQLELAMEECPEAFVFAEDGDSTSSGGRGIVACNANYIVCDFNPGRNTFIDAHTGRVRFIDPRISLNTPDSPYRFAGTGRRRQWHGVIDIAATVAAARDEEVFCDE